MHAVQRRPQRSVYFSGSVLKTFLKNLKVTLFLLILSFSFSYIYNHIHTVPFIYLHKNTWVIPMNLFQLMCIILWTISLKWNIAFCCTGNKIWMTATRVSVYGCNYAFYLLLQSKNSHKKSFEICCISKDSRISEESHIRFNTIAGKLIRHIHKI